MLAPAALASDSSTATTQVGEVSRSERPHRARDREGAGRPHRGAGAGLAGRQAGLRGDASQRSGPRHPASPGVRRRHVGQHVPACRSRPRSRPDSGCWTRSAPTTRSAWSCSTARPACRPDDVQCRRLSAPRCRRSTRSSGTALYDGVATAAKLAGRDAARQPCRRGAVGRRRHLLEPQAGRARAAAASLRRGGGRGRPDGVGLLRRSDLRSITDVSGGAFAPAASVSDLEPITVKLAQARLAGDYALDVALPHSSSA